MRKRNVTDREPGTSSNGKSINNRIISPNVHSNQNHNRKNSHSTTTNNNNNNNKHQVTPGETSSNSPVKKKPPKLLDHDTDHDTNCCPDLAKLGKFPHEYPRGNDLENISSRINIAWTSLDMFKIKMAYTNACEDENIARSPDDPVQSESDEYNLLLIMTFFYAATNDQWPLDITHISSHKNFGPGFRRFLKDQNLLKMKRRGQNKSGKVLANDGTNDSDVMNTREAMDGGNNFDENGDDFWGDNEEEYVGSLAPLPLAEPFVTMVIASDGCGGANGIRYPSGGIQQIADDLQYQANRLPFEHIDVHRGMNNVFDINKLTVYTEQSLAAADPPVTVYLIIARWNDNKRCIIMLPTGTLGTMNCSALCQKTINSRGGICNTISEPLVVFAGPIYRRWVDGTFLTIQANQSGSFAQAWEGISTVCCSGTTRPVTERKFEPEQQITRPKQLKACTKRLVVNWETFFQMTDFLKNVAQASPKVQALHGRHIDATSISVPPNPMNRTLGFREEAVSKMRDVGSVVVDAARFVRELNAVRAAWNNSRRFNACMAKLFSNLSFRLDMPPTKKKPILTHIEFDVDSVSVQCSIQVSSVPESEQALLQRWYPLVVDVVTGGIELLRQVLDRSTTTFSRAMVLTHWARWRTKLGKGDKTPALGSRCYVATPTGGDILHVTVVSNASASIETRRALLECHFSVLSFMQRQNSALYLKPGDVTNTDQHFQFSTNGGAVFPILVLLLFAHRHPSEEHMVCIESYGNKNKSFVAKYPSVDSLPSNGRALCNTLAQQATTDPVFWVGRLMRLFEEQGVLVRGKTQIRSGVGQVLAGNIVTKDPHGVARTTAALITFDVVRPQEALLHTTRPLHQLFQAKPQHTDGGDEEKDDEDEDEEGEEGEEDEEGEEGEEDGEEGADDDANDREKSNPPLPRPTTTTTTTTTTTAQANPPYKVRRRNLSNTTAGRKHLEIYHPIHGILPWQLSMNFFLTKGHEQYFKFNDRYTPEANLIRGQQYSPQLRHGVNEDGKHKSTSHAIDIAAHTITSTTRLGTQMYSISWSSIKSALGTCFQNLRTWIGMWQQQEEHRTPFGSRLELSNEYSTEETSDGKFVYHQYMEELCHLFHDAVEVAKQGAFEGRDLDTVLDCIQLTGNAIEGISIATTELGHSICTVGAESSDTATSKATELAVATKQTRALVHTLYNGKWSYGNPFLFAPAISTCYLFRMVLYPACFVPRLGQIVDETMGCSAEEYDAQVLQPLGILQATRKVERDLSIHQEFIEDPESRIGMMRGTAFSAGGRELSGLCEGCNVPFNKDMDPEMFKKHPCTFHDLNIVDHLLDWDDERTKRIMAKMRDSLSKDQKLAFETAMKSNLIVCEPGGLGKSTFARFYVITLTSTKGPHSFIAISKTHAGARQSLGKTAHSVLRWGILNAETLQYIYHSNPQAMRDGVRQFLRDRFSDPQDTERWIKAEALIIDEFGQWRKVVMEWLDIFCQEVRGVQQPFGGLRVCLIGDPTQNHLYFERDTLADLKTRFNRNPIKDAADYLFQCPTFASWGLHVVPFARTTNQRFASSQELHELYLRVRHGTFPNPEADAAILRRCGQAVPIEDKIRLDIMDIVAALRHTLKFTDTEVDNFLKEPKVREVYNTLQNKFEQDCGNSFLPLSNRRVLAVLGRQQDFLTNGSEGMTWWRYLARAITSSHTLFLVTEKVQVTAMAVVTNFITKQMGWIPLVAVKVTDECTYRNAEGIKVPVLNFTEWYHSTSNKDRGLKRWIAKETVNQSTVDDTEERPIFAGQALLSRTTDSNNYLAKNDIFTAQSYDEQEQVLHVELKLDHLGKQNQYREIPSEVVVTIELRLDKPNIDKYRLDLQSLLTHQVLLRLDYLAKSPKPSTLYIKRSTLPVVTDLALTTMSATGLTVPGPLAASNTRYMKGGDGNLMVSRATDASFLHLSHIPAPNEFVKDFAPIPAAVKFDQYLQRMATNYATTTVSFSINFHMQNDQTIQDPKKKRCQQYSAASV